MMQPKWLEWAKALQSIAQTGLHYTAGVFDRDRYEQILDIAAEIVALHTGQPTETLRSAYALETGPGTPKTDVRGAVFQDGALLLVREKLDGDRWTLPGGWADVNETPSESVVREIWEESGYYVRVVKLIGLYDPSRHDHPRTVYHRYTSFFLCELTGGAPAESIETSGVGFFREHELPESEALSTGRVTRQQLLRCFEHFHNPNLPTDFD